METAWLIEIGSPPLYLENVASTGIISLTRDHLQALRFSRRIDGDKLIYSLGLVCLGKVIEHSWSD